MQLRCLRGVLKKLKKDAKDSPHDYEMLFQILKGVIGVIGADDDCDDEMKTLSDVEAKLNYLGANVDNCLLMNLEKRKVEIDYFTIN